MPLPPQDKATLKANALAKMYSITACDWAKTVVPHMYGKLIASPTMQNTSELLTLAVEDEMEDLYKILTNYFKEEKTDD